MKKTLYIFVAATLSVLLLTDYVPFMQFCAGWVTPPISLLCGLLFALLVGEVYPSFNKTMSKKLLQYSVVGLGFGMNVEAALQSGREGMLFTIVSVFGTLLLGWFIGRKLLKIDLIKTPRQFIYNEYDIIKETQEPDKSEWRSSYEQYHKAE